jgi:hypothetical protein
VVVRVAEAAVVEVAEAVVEEKLEDYHLILYKYQYSLP